MREREDEWQVVRRRRVGRPVSESFPVRHSKYPSHRFYPRQHPVGRRNGMESNGRQSQDPPRDSMQQELQGNDGITFFFNNFPEGCWAETLKKKFSVVGRVIDIFCPKKRDIKGKPFGFVRFEVGLDQNWILSELNKLWIGTYKIRAYVPRFKRPAMEESKKKDEGSAEIDRIEKKAGEGDKGRGYQIFECRKTYEKSFAEALSNISSKTDDEEGKKEEVMEFQTSDIEKEWLKESLTGSIKTDFTWEEVKEELLSECGSMFKITSMGGNFVLIQSLSHTPAKVLLNDLDEWATFWFEWIRPWKSEVVNAQRLVWTKWFGVPLHVWNPRFFESVGNRLGRITNIHEDTRDKHRLDFALIQFSIDITTSLNMNFACRIDRELFQLRVEEIG